MRLHGLPNSTWALAILACGVVGAASPGTAWAAKKSKGPAPAITHLVPSGGKAGSSFACTIGGTLSKSENQVWADHPGIVFHPTAKPEIFDVTIAPDAPPGPHLVRFFNDDGASPPRIFVVGTYDEASDIEPNDDARKPQRLSKIPVTVNGVLEKSGDTDTFAFRAEAGRWIVLDLNGYALGSTMDPAMRLLDERGVEIEMSHDTHNLDPFIAWRVTKSGVYLAQVMAFAHPPAADVTLKGSASHVYRLTITDQPYARAAWPCAAARENPGKVKLLGWNFGDGMEGPEAGLDEEAGTTGADLRRVRSANGESVLVAVVDSPIMEEIEPAKEATKAQAIHLPTTICGRIDAPKDEDRFSFAASKGDNLEFRVRSFALHAPTDAWLRIEDPQGKVLQQSDDEKEGGFDPLLKWKAPADGEYVLAIGDLFGRGGWQYVYAIEAGPPVPRVQATIDANAYKVDAGNSIEIKVSVKTSGEFKGKFTVKAEGLPEGVSAKPAEVNAKGGEAKLTLNAEAAAASTGGPFEVTLSTSSPDAPRTIKADFEIAVTEPRGDRLINRDSRAWLTVAGKGGQPPAANSGSAPAAAEVK